MIALMWKLSRILRLYLHRYMPSNIAMDLLRTPRGLRWAAPCAVVIVAAYLFAAAMALSSLHRGGPSWLNGVVLVLIWSAMKFAWMAIFSPIQLLRARPPRRDG